MMLCIQVTNYNFFKRSNIMVDGNLVEMGKLIGAGLACTGMGGAAIGLSLIHI